MHPVAGCVNFWVTGPNSAVLKALSAAHKTQNNVPLVHFFKAHYWLILFAESGF
jgi:hypothetical protein